jgi:hypothetical protein
MLLTIALTLSVKRRTNGAAIKASPRIVFVQYNMECLLVQDAEAERIGEGMASLCS